MLAASEADQLLTRARDEGARLILVGDVRQLGSVGAGRAFAQLQEAGMATPVLDQIVRQTNAHTKEAVEAMLAGEAARAFDAIDRGGGRIVQHAEDDIRRALIARDFAKLSRDDRAGTLVLDPTREGRARLTDAIRAALVRDGTLGQDAVVASVLEPCGLSRAEAAHAASYAPGSVVTFRQGNRDARISRGRAYRVDADDAEAGTVALVSPQGKRVAWSPARWGGDQAEAYTEAQAEFRTGDRLQFTRNNRAAHRNNGDTAEVVAIDSDHGRVTVAKGGWLPADPRHGPARRSACAAWLGADHPQLTGRDVRSGHGPPGELPRQHRRCRIRLCRDQQGQDQRGRLHRQPHRPHRRTRPTRWGADRGYRFQLDTPRAIPLSVRADHSRFLAQPF
jgi:ATP-dependent exoDNAse (exonuclease V) alpha subunit